MMKKAEIILIGVFIIGLILYTFKLSGGSFLLIMSLGSLSVIYFLFGAILFKNTNVTGTLDKLSKNGLNKGNVKIALKKFGIGYAFSVAVIGILFKLLSWLGADIMLMIGTIGICIVAVILVSKQRKDKRSSNIVKRAILFGGLCLFLLLLPTKTWLNFRYPDNPDYVQAVLEYQEDPTNKELKDKVEEERHKLKQ